MNKCEKCGTQVNVIKLESTKEDGTYTTYLCSYCFLTGLSIVHTPPLELKVIPHEH